jgi:hypothetical protein
VLALPSLEQPFHFVVNINKGAAFGVLTQKPGGQRQLVLFLSKFLDPVTWGWPECIQAIAAITLLNEECRKITSGGSLVISTLHQERTILNQKVGRWLTDSRILKYEAILLEKDDLTLTTEEALNLATFLVEKQEGRAPKHKCYWIPNKSKARPQGNSFPDRVPFLCGWVLSGNWRKKTQWIFYHRWGGHDW